MKIDTDLRLAIKAAERAQPHESWDIRRDAEQKSIVDFFKKYPAKARRAKRLDADIATMEKKLAAAKKELCDSYGLQTNSRSDYKTGFTYSNCGGSGANFTKAGGKIPAKYAPWKADDVIAQIARATAKEGAKIIKSLGINWE